MPYNWRHAPRWQRNLYQFLGTRQGPDGQWTALTQPIASPIVLTSDTNVPQFRITVHPDDWLYIDGLTNDARDLVDALGEIAERGPMGNKNLQHLHRLVS